MPRSVTAVPTTATAVRSGLPSVIMVATLQNQPCNKTLVLDKQEPRVPMPTNLLLAIIAKEKGHTNICSCDEMLALAQCFPYLPCVDQFQVSSTYDPFNLFVFQMALVDMRRQAQTRICLVLLHMTLLSYAAILNISREACASSSLH